MGKDVKEHYTSFSDMATAHGCRFVEKKTRDKAKLVNQQNRFMKNHKCRGCGQPMSLIPGSNVMVCKNPSCNGVKFTKKDSAGDAQDIYLMSYDVLDDIGAEIANNILD